jgi:hypothetical protein
LVLGGHHGQDVTVSVDPCLERRPVGRSDDHLSDTSVWFSGGGHWSDSLAAFTSIASLASAYALAVFAVSAWCLTTTAT